MASMVGASVVRKEDPRLLTGRGSYIDDLSLPGTATMVFVRSYDAHAEVRSVDTSGARALPGVLGAWSHAELVAALDGDPVPAYAALPGGTEQPLLATDRVHYVGEPVAVIVATDRFAAADAVAHVLIDTDPLPAVTGVDEALADDAPTLLEGLPSNVIVDQPPPDIEEALAAAPRRTSLRVVNNRCAAVPIEPGGCLARWDSDGLALWATVQAPHQVKNRLAKDLGLPLHQVRVVAPDIGGGFGGKIQVYPEFLLAPLLSRLLGRPVSFLETRSENLVAMTHGRDQVHDIEVGFDDEGRLLALKVAITQNAGWPTGSGAGLPMLTATMAAGCYKIPTVAAGFRAVATNTTPIAAYRGAGRPEASYAIERVVDLVADETGVDPLEVRRRNFIQPDDFPYALHAPGFAYDSGDYEAALDKLLGLIDYETLRKEQQVRRDDPDQALMGIGFSTYVELGGLGPSPIGEAFGWIGGWESSAVRVLPDGSVTMTTGTSPHGQGHETTYAQIAADQLGIDVDSIQVLHSDTDSVQEGMGTMGSRAAAVGGPAVHRAAGKVREKALRLAAHLLEANADDLDVGDGRFTVRGSPEASVSFADVAAAAYKVASLPPDTELGLEATAYFEPTNLTYPSGSHCCVVGVDRLTGEVTVERYVSVDDCGVRINPLIAKGQIHGGVAQGIAQALYEEITYDPDTGQPTASNLVGYLVPAAPDLPALETDRVETPTPINPLGAQGIGESGATGAPQAVVNAVVDALSHLGVRHLDMPLTPQRVWRTLRDAQGVSA